MLHVDASEVLNARQKERLRAALGPRVTAVAQDARSQTRNREIALARLRRKIELALHVPRKRTPTRPTKGSKTRRLEAKRRQAERKRDRRRPPDD